MIIIDLTFIKNFISLINFYKANKKNGGQTLLIVLKRKQNGVNGSFSFLDKSLYRMYII